MKKTHGASIPNDIWEWLGKLLEDQELKTLWKRYGIRTRTKALIVLARAGEIPIRKDAAALREQLDLVTQGKNE